MVRRQRKSAVVGTPGRAGRPIRLRVSHAPRLGRYVASMVRETYFLQTVLLLIGLWLSFSLAMYVAERSLPGTTIDSYGDALYWGVAALSTAGIADTPKSGLAMAIGGTWIIVGSILFFGTIVASITGYFMRPVLRPARQIIDTIEYNLEHMDNLSVAELQLLKKTTDGLIAHMERIKSQE